MTLKPRKTDFTPPPEKVSEDDVAPVSYGEVINAEAVEPVSFVSEIHDGPVGTPSHDWISYCGTDITYGPDCQQLPSDASLFVVTGEFTKLNPARMTVGELIDAKDKLSRQLCIGLRKTAVIIGHGPSPKGRGWGSQIDKADIVIRMFDNAWQAPADYGTKYDIGVVTLAKRNLEWFQTEATLKPGKWWLYRHDGALFNVKTEAPQETFDCAEDRQFALDIGALTTGGNFALTRGTATACHAIRSLRPDKLILVGFDEIREGAFSHKPYSDECMTYMSQRQEFRQIESGLAERPYTGLTKSAGHDIEVEMVVIMNAAQLNQAEVLHAEEAFS